MYPDSSSFSRSSGGAGHLQSGDLSLKGVGKLLSRALLHGLALDGSDRSGKVSLAGRTVSDDDGFVQALGILVQYDIVGAGGSYSLHISLIPDGCDLDSGSGR